MSVGRPKEWAEYLGVLHLAQRIRLEWKTFHHRATFPALNGGPKIEGAIVRALDLVCKSAHTRSKKPTLFEVSKGIVHASILK